MTSRFSFLDPVSVTVTVKSEAARLFLSKSRPILRSACCRSLSLAFSVCSLSLPSPACSRTKKPVQYGCFFILPPFRATQDKGLLATFGTGTNFHFNTGLNFFPAFCKKFLFELPEH